ncbi:c-type cytochrome domain-containing protein [Neorhodopirellula pilleata]|nr:c-type cytochrome domain-containing protein [Neorhodopirellula pilleata]
MKIRIHGNAIRHVLLAAGVLTTLTPAWAEAEKSPEAAVKITYEDHVKPIFREHCLTCHNQGDKRGGLALDSYGVLMEGGGSGEVVYDDGDADASRLWQLVNHDDTPVMPPNQPKIPAKQLEVLRAWIEGGILENSGSKAKEKKKNALAMATPSTGKPEGPPPMPKSLPQSVPVVTPRAAAITAIGTSPWAPLVAVAGQKQIVLYHTETGELLGILPFDEGIPQSLRFSKDGRYLVAGGGEHSVHGIAAVYNIETGERMASVGDELDTVFDADCNDTMSRIALGGPQKMLRIFDATDGTLLFDLKKHTDWIYGVAFSPDGVLVASSDRSGGLCVWEADTGRLYLDLTDHKGAVNSVSWRDDSNVLASASSDGTVKLWDMVSGKAIKSISVNGGAVMSVRFDHKGQLVTATSDRKVRLFDANGTQIKEFPPMKEAALEAAISHDSQHVVYGDWSGEVNLTPVADPSKAMAIAANPPPAQERLKHVEQTLAGIREQLAPLIQKQAEAQANLDAAKKASADAETQLNQYRGEVTATQQKVTDTVAASKQKQDSIPKLVTESRDQHDAIIAARLALGDATDPAKSESIAAAETKLAGTLTTLAQSRRAITESAKQVAEFQKQVVDLQNKVKTAEASVNDLKLKVDAADKAFQAAKAAHDAVAGQLSEQERKKQELVSAVNS